MAESSSIARCTAQYQLPRRRRRPPEFSLYLPGHGGNLKLGVSAAGGSKWLAQAAEVVARYRPGRMIYEVRDPLLARGWLRIEVLTGPGSGPDAAS